MTTNQPPEVAGAIAEQVARGGLTTEQLDTYPVGVRVRRISDPTVVYHRRPDGPNGPWRRYEAGVGPVTCRSSTLAMIGVELHRCAACRCDPVLCETDDTGQHCTDRGCSTCMCGCPIDGCPAC